MKKFLLSGLICLAVIGSVSAMEQHLDLSCVLEELPIENLVQIAYLLDGKSFSSLTQVCFFFKEICDDIPVKYLAIDFSDAANYASAKLIDRFIAEPDRWMFKKDEKFISGFTDCNDDDIVRIFECSFGKGLQSFLGDCSIYRVSYNEITIRYLVSWHDFLGIEIDSKPVYVMHLNVGECNEMVNRACGQWSKGWCFDAQTSHGGCQLQIYQGPLCFRKTFQLSNLSHSAETLFKKFGMLAVFIFAAQKNDMKVLYSIMNNATIFDCWSPDTLLISLMVNCSDAIKDVLSAISFERKQCDEQRK